MNAASRQPESVVCAATTGDDLDAVLLMEQADENAAFIRQWPREEHLAAISDSNIAHLLVRATSDQRMVGYVILIGLNDPDDSVEFKRIVIVEKDHGFGRATVSAVKHLVFIELQKHRLWLEVMTTNIRAAGLYESEGFVVEGVHRESLKRDDAYDSLTVMSMLATEYQESTS